MVCEARGHAACLAGVELPSAEPRPDLEREFEVIWSVEPDAVRVASDLCLGLARRASTELASGIEGRDSRPKAPPATEEQLRLAATITTRTLRQLG